MKSLAAGRRTNSVAFDGLSSIGNLKTKPGRNSTPRRGVKRISNSRQKKVVDEDEDECFICLAAAPEVGVAGCDHKLCKSCANQMVLRLHKAPLTCPFCRQDVSGFVSIS